MIKTISGDTIVENYYNGEGLRVAKVVNGVLTRYLYEYDKVVLELDADGNQTGRNIYGTNLLMRTVDGESYYYLYNGHGDVVALVNALTGNIDATYYYDAFGNILESDGVAKDKNSILYAGYQYDEETGLYYLNARMYDPKIARFLQEDTYTGDPNDPLSLNLYTYCANNPIKYDDPTGHFLHVIGGALLGAGISAVIDVGSQMLIQRRSFKDIDWTSVGVSAFEGLVSGGLAAATGGASLAATAAKGAVKATGKQIIKQAAKTAVIEGVLGAGINAGAQKLIKKDVDWAEVAISGISDAISGGVGSALPNTKLGKKLMEAGDKAKAKVGDFLSSVGDSIKKQVDNVKNQVDNMVKQIDNAFSPKLAAANGINIDINSFDNALKNVDVPNVKTPTQINYMKVMQEANAKPKVDVNAGVGNSSNLPAVIDRRAAAMQKIQKSAIGEGSGPVIELPAGNTTNNFGKLKSLGNGTWESTEGLIYGQEKYY